MQKVVKISKKITKIEKIAKKFEKMRKMCNQKNAKYEKAKIRLTGKWHLVAIRSVSNLDSIFGAVSVSAHFGVTLCSIDLYQALEFLRSTN